MLAGLVSAAPNQVMFMNSKFQIKGFSAVVRLY